MTQDPMIERTNAGLIRQLHQAIRAADTATLEALIADDVVWHVAGHSRLSGELSGRVAVLGFLDSLRSLSGGSFTLEDDDLLASPERAVSLCRVSARREGKTLDADYCQVIRVREDHIAEGWSFAFDQSAFDFFWL